MTHGWGGDSVYIFLSSGATLTWCKYNDVRQLAVHSSGSEPSGVVEFSYHLEMQVMDPSLLSLPSYICYIISQLRIFMHVLPICIHVSLTNSCPCSKKLRLVNSLFIDIICPWTYIAAPPIRVWGTPHFWAPVAPGAGF